jgi:hypothetical protein
MKGPFVIVGRGHSGTRLLCDAFLQNGLWMGLTDDRATRDSRLFSPRNPTVRYLVQEAFHYDELPEAERAHTRHLLSQLVDELRRDCPADAAAFGWKRPLSTFLVEIILDTLPSSKVVHLIRDGRDVMLSRRKRPIERLHDPFDRMLTFSEPMLTTYRGKPLAQAILENRDELEMHHWVTAVRSGMRGRKHPDRYLEVLYEELCRRPVEVLNEVFDFLNVPFAKQARDWIVASTSTARIGKWRGSAAELCDAIAIGEPLLRELGYATDVSN